MTGLSISKSLELVLCQPTLTAADIADACDSAAEQHLAAVIVNPVHVARAAAALAGTDTRLIAAIGFPFGQDEVMTRLGAVERARAAGVDDITIAVDNSLVVAGDGSAIAHELRLLVEALSWASVVSSRGSGHLTVVMETQRAELELLQPVWPVLADSAVSFLQTSFGWGGVSTAEDHIRALRAVVPASVQLKACGGIATLDDAVTLLSAGAVRACSSAALSIIAEENERRALRTSRERES